MTGTASLSPAAASQSLQLNSNMLTGSIPTEIRDLTSLEALDLEDNSLSGAIPTELGSLSNLTDLDLSGNV